MPTIVTEEVINYISSSNEKFSVELTANNILLRPIDFFAIVKVTYSDSTIKLKLYPVFHKDTIGELLIAKEELAGYMGVVDDEVQAQTLCNSNLPILYL